MCRRLRLGVVEGGRVGLAVGIGEEEERVGDLESEGSSISLTEAAKILQVYSILQLIRLQRLCVSPVYIPLPSCFLSVLAEWIVELQ